MNEPTLKVIVALPAYNEEKYIGSLVLLAKRYADEVIVVDDGSTDGTAEIAGLAGAAVIRHQQNQGKGAAVQSILSEARKRNTDTLVILDADYQHRPEEIPRLTEAVAQGFDLVIGSRKVQSASIPAYRRAGQRVIAYFSHILSQDKISDTESGFRALSKKAIAEIQLKERGFAVESEMISAAVKMGLKVTEVPISVIYTKDGSTLNPVTHGIGVLNRLMVMISERRPLLFFGLVGGILIGLGIVAGAGVARTYYASLVLATGTALIAILLVTIGVLSIFTGIILNVLVKRISESLKPGGPSSRQD